LSENKERSMRSMAKEGRLGKSLAADLPGLLRRIVPAEVWRSFYGMCAKRGDRRTRWSPKHIVLAWLVMGWIARGGLGERFEGAWRTLTALFPQRRRAGRTYAGLNLCSRGVNPTAAQHFLASLRPRLQRGLRPLWHWRGWIVFAVDGSRVDVPRTRANERGLGRAGRDKSAPQFWLTTLIQLPSRVIWDWRQDVGTASERTHLREMLDSFPAGALLLADAGFVGFGLMSEMVRRGVDFVIRCGANATLLIEAAEPVDLRHASAAPVMLWPSGWRGEPPLALRLITLRRGKQCIHLLTSVREECRLPRRAAGEMYSARWGVEVNYRSLKQTLERRKLRARSPAIGAWELAGNVLALALLLVMAAWLQGVRAARASMARLLRAIRAALERFWYGRSTHGLGRRLRQAVCDEYKRRRSKRARDWPHKKHEKPAGAPNLRSMTERELAAIARVNAMRVAINA
jgi:Transposase DDE domain